MCTQHRHGGDVLALHAHEEPPTLIRTIRGRRDPLDPSMFSCDLTRSAAPHTTPVSERPKHCRKWRAGMPTKQFRTHFCSHRQFPVGAAQAKVEVEEERRHKEESQGERGKTIKKKEKESRARTCHARQSPRINSLDRIGMRCLKMHENGTEPSNDFIILVVRIHRCDDLPTVHRGDHVCVCVCVFL
jgi:hypothetical protein